MRPRGAPFSTHTVGEKPEDIGLTVGPVQRLGEWFNPIDPAKYQ